MDALKRITSTSLIFAAAVLLGVAHAGTPNSVDHSDLWWNAQESGWGLSLYQQDNVIFGTLYVYGPDGNGTWFAASGLRPATSPSGNPTWSGPLFRTRGPAFTNPEFDPATVTVTRVGELRAEFTSAYAATVTYNVDAVHVVKQVTRQTWRDIYLNSRFRGGMSATPTSCVPGVPRLQLENVGVWRVNKSVEPRIQFNNLAGCTLTGDLERQGRLSRIPNGTMECVPPTGAAYKATFSLEELDTYQAGLSGRIRIVDSFCTYEGSFGGRYEALSIGNDDDFAGMWWNPLESGWGIGVHSQAQSGFMTIYTYGPSGDPVFFVGPGVGFRFGYFNLPPPKPPLYRTQGTYFGVPFDASAVKATVAGALEDPQVSAGTYRLAANLDGSPFTDTLTRMSFAPASMAGTYVGGIVPGNHCGHVGYEGKLAIEQDGAALRMALAFKGNSGSSGMCTLAATARADGHQLTLRGGTYTCDPNDGFAAHSGTFTAGVVEVKQYGFSGFFSGLDDKGCNWGWTIGGIRAASK